ncbi:MAG: Crp/Fnr family transcriptional regulator [Verrucomicrobia bacterium]|nr:Crp/Fnr family transcriptional regulator [Verrucomicrobiota bacterium]
MPTSVDERRRSAVAKTLRRCRLFAGISPADIHRAATFTVVKTLAKGDYLFHEGSPVHGFYIVRHGAVKVHRVNILGKEQVLHIFRPTESFAEESLLAEAGHPAHACATELSEVLLVQKAGFLALLRRQPDLALSLLRAMNRHLQILVRLLDDLTLKDVKTRLAHWLLQRCPNPESRRPVSIHLATTKRVLAAELGTVSETLSRTVAKFRDLNLLTVEGNRVTLLCPVRLARLVAPGPTPLPPTTATLVAKGSPGQATSESPPQTVGNRRAEVLN